MTINLPPLKFGLKNSKQPVTTINSKLKQQQQGFQCPTVRQSIADKKNKLLTSQLLVDDYPKLPLKINSQQPVISVTKDKNLTTPILYLTASSMLYQLPEQTVNEVSISSSSSRRKSTDTTTSAGIQMSSISGMKELGNHFPSTSSVSQISSSDSKTDDRLHHQQQQQQQERTKMSIFHPSKRIFFTPLLITNFRPLLAPFVPVFIQILVNQTEAECYQTTWNLIFDDLSESYAEAKVALIKIIYYWQNENKLKHIIGKLGLDVKIMTLRLFLNELERKLLNFSRSSTMCMVQSPLLDLFLRPNKQIRCIVQHTALSQSCVQMDTLAFIMIHLLHAWECSSNPIEGKVSLGRIYGRLLISFSDKPELRGLEHNNSAGGASEDPKTIESILLELILELCDFHFWQQLTMLKIRSVFEYISDVEKRFAKDFRIRQQQSMTQYIKKVSHDYLYNSVKDVHVDDEDDDDEEEEEEDKDDGDDDDGRVVGGSRHDTVDAAVDSDDVKKTKLSKHKVSNKTREKLNAAEKDLKGLDQTCIMDIFPPKTKMTTNVEETDSVQTDPNLTCEVNLHRKRTHYFSSTTLPLIIPFVELSLLDRQKKQQAKTSNTTELCKPNIDQLKLLTRSTDRLLNEIIASRTKKNVSIKRMHEKAIK